MVFDNRVAPSRKLQHVLVPPAMLIAAIAIGIAGNLHLGLSPEVSIAVGVCLFCLMLMSHLLLRVADDADRAEEETTERRTEQVASPMPMAPRNGLLPADEAHTMAAVEPTAATIYEPTAAAGFDEQHSFRPAQHEPMHEPMPGAPHPAVREPADTALPENYAGAAASDWGYRPTVLREPDLGQIAIDGSSPEPMSQRELPELGNLRPAANDALVQYPTVGAHDPQILDREADRIDAILKRLALQIHTGSAERRRTEAAPREAAERGEPELAMPAAPDDGAALEKLAAEQPENALASAVDALRSTVEAMRGPAVAASAPPSAVELRIAAVAEAIQAERADVFLSPILGLADQQAHHFEVSVKLRADEIDAYDPREVAAGAGLLPLLDALNVRHAAGFALMLDRRARAGSVFSRIGGTSLQDERFVNDTSGQHAQGIADRMVLTFAQEDVRGLGPAQFAALGDLGRLGFRFALDGVADLDMDFEALEALGFDFVKLDTSVFQGGLICSGEHVLSSDICRHLEDMGLAVVVTGIGDAATRDLMAGCGVLFGQGELFGAPRPVPVASPAGGSMAA